MNTKKSSARANLEQEVRQAIGRSRGAKMAVGYRLIGSGKAVVSDGVGAGDGVLALGRARMIGEEVDRLAQSFSVPDENASTKTLVVRIGAGKRIAQCPFAISGDAPAIAGSGLICIDVDDREADESSRRLITDYLDRLARQN